MTSIDRHKMALGNSDKGKSEDHVYLFPYILGQALGSMARDDVRRMLLSNGVKEEELKALEAASIPIITSFYRA